jgi:hypothetical protein
MKKIELKSRKLLRAIFGGFSLTAIAFIFQACYGPAQDDIFDLKLSGTVMSKTTNIPIEGIKVTVNDVLNYGTTDKDGKFDFHAAISRGGYYDGDTYYTPDSVRIHFCDTDEVKNGSFSDTTIVIGDFRSRVVKMNVQMEEN